MGSTKLFRANQLRCLQVTGNSIGHAAYLTTNSIKLVALKVPAFTLPESLTLPHFAVKIRLLYTKTESLVFTALNCSKML